MKKITLVTALLLHVALYAAPPPLLSTGDSVVAEDVQYYTYPVLDKNIEIIYTEKNREFASHTLEVEESLNSKYADFFQWNFDERLYVGLISDCNQIANGFSSQWPNNRQINYLGGTQLIDYFTTTSWLDTLLYHETAHNYQLNVKGSEVSRSLHSIFGNGTFLIPLPLIVPNVTENSFMLEGNAVLNESWHGNGGRLYSGRFKAETILQAKAQQLKPEYLYNKKLLFPYGEIPYIQGGFYNLYLAEKYGLKALNSYFKIHSQDFWWPFFTNDSMQEAIGIDFETSVEAFAKEQKRLAEDFVELEGTRVASSQFFYSLSHSKDKIFFLTNESGVRAPELVVIDKKSKVVQKTRASYIGGKVIQSDGIYYTQGSRKISPTKISQGLFDQNAYIKKGSTGKMVQAYLSDGRAVYFDVASSYSQAQLYIDGLFYTQVNSSVVIDQEDNLYYFKQKGKLRTLYKNREPLFSYEGFYGIVSDVDSRGDVYFVANSALGSTLYRWSTDGVFRVSDADNIVEARLVNDKELLIAAIGATEYYYAFTSVKNLSETPYVTKLFFEDNSYYGDVITTKPKIDIGLKKEYNAPLDMHYSGANIYFGYDSVVGYTGSATLNFSDPLSQNAANIFVRKDTSDVTIAGAGYSSSEYLLSYMIQAYGVVANGNSYDVREGGVLANVLLPLYEAGYNSASVGVSYFQDYDTLSREPLTLLVTLSHQEQYGVSMYENTLHNFNIYGVKDREDSILGVSYQFKHDLPVEFYIGLDMKYSQSDSMTWINERGVKISNIIYQENMDPSTVVMPSIESAVYAKSAGYGGVKLTKVFNSGAYFFTFPISLQRESIYASYRHYDVEDFRNRHHLSNEFTVGTTLSTVYLNSFAVPISFEYISNDADFIKDKSKVRFLFGINF